MRWAKQPSPIWSDCLRTRAHLRPPLAPGDERERWMIPRMIADSVLRLGGTPHQVGVALCRCADHEEGRLCLMLVQNIEQAGRKLGMRPIVKCKRHDRG